MGKGLRVDRSVSTNKIPVHVPKGGKMINPYALMPLPNNTIKSIIKPLSNHD